MDFSTRVIDLSAAQYGVRDQGRLFVVAEDMQQYKRIVAQELIVVHEGHQKKGEIHVRFRASKDPYVLRDVLARTLELVESAALVCARCGVPLANSSNAKFELSFSYQRSQRDHTLTDASTATGVRLCSPARETQSLAVVVGM